MDTLVRVGRENNSARLAASGRFGIFKPESEQPPVRKLEVVQNETLNKLLGVWKDPSWQSAPHTNNEWEADSWCLNRLRRLFGKVSYSVEDVANFSFALAQFQTDPWFYHSSNIFLSALINNGRDQEYVIFTTHMNAPYSGGFRNTKDIIIKGNAGHALGKSMIGGSVIVEGDAGKNVGLFMDGGRIVVKGDSKTVGDSTHGGHILIQGKTGMVGRGMDGGAIEVIGDADEIAVIGGGIVTIHGDVTHAVSGTSRKGSVTVMGDVHGSVGSIMSGGEIHIEGEIGEISEKIKHGKIFHNGVLIVDK